MGRFACKRREIRSGDTKYDVPKIQSVATRTQTARQWLAHSRSRPFAHQAVVLLMGKIHITGLGGLGSSENTLNEYDNEVSEELLDRHLVQVADILGKNDDSVCYVLGMGAQPKGTYAALKKERGIDVVWTRSILPDPLKILGFFIASYSGLVKILDHEKLPSITKKLSHLSMAGVYVIDKSMEKEFVDCVSGYPSPRNFDFGTKSDSRYFFLIVDGDNSESTTGIVEIVSYGKSSCFATLM